MNTTHNYARQIRGAAKQLLLASTATLAMAGAAYAQIPSAPDQAPPPNGQPPAGPIANGSKVQPSGSDQGPAPAAAYQQARGDGGALVGEVVVTARRRSENIERVPVAVSALSGAQLAQQSIYTQADLQRAVPGLTVRATSSENDLNYAIRGQSIDAFSGSQPAVVQYVNDVALDFNNAGSLFDLDSVQVLKGPQGTLFGRNATGGAVLFSTAKPTNTFGGYVTGQIGNFDLREGQGAVNLPLVDGKVLLRVAGDWIAQDGDIANVYDGSHRGAIDRKSGRISLLVHPIEKFTSTTVFEYDDAGGNNAGNTLYSAPACGTTNHGISLGNESCYYSPLLDTLIGVPGAYAAFLKAHPQSFQGSFQQALAYVQGLPSFTVDQAAPSYHHAHDFFITNTSSYELASNLTVKNIIGGGNTVSNDSADLQGTPFPVEDEIDRTTNQSGFIRDESQISDEFQILGKAFDQRLNYIVGAYYLFERQILTYNIAALDVTPYIPPTNARYDYEQPDQSEALFFQGTYDTAGITGIKGLSVTGGFRYTFEQIHFKQFADSVFGGGAPEHRDFSNPSWQVGLEYQINPELLLYVEQRGSWRSGGFNGTAPDVAGPASALGNEFDPETTYDVEVGEKFQGQVLGHTSRLNIALYNQWVDNVQRNQVIIFPNGSPGSVTVNIPQAEISGLELDSQTSLTDWLDTGVSFAYTYARFTSPDSNLFGTVLPFGPYADTPRYSGDVFASVTLPTPADLGRMNVRADTYAQSASFFSNLDNTVNPGTKIRGYALVNARFNWQVMDTHVNLALFVTNLFNSGYFVGGFPSDADFGSEGAAWGRPRMYGVEATYKF